MVARSGSPIDNPVLNHGDTTLSNFLYRGTEVAAVVDWERAMITDRLWDQMRTGQVMATRVRRVARRPRGRGPRHSRHSEAGRASGRAIPKAQSVPLALLLSVRLRSASTASSNSRLAPLPQSVQASPNSM